MKLVDDANNWSKWWSIRLSIIGGFLLTVLEGFPNAVATVLLALPEEIKSVISPEHLKLIGIVCILASPIARVIKQSKLDSNG